MSELRELLSWYSESGVDVVLDDFPHDRFAESSISPPKPSNKVEVVSSPSASASTPPPSTPSDPVDPTESVIRDARSLASSAKDLESLRVIISDFDGCNLKQTCRSTVFADGDPSSDLMIIGEAPGRDEDEQGFPFVGRSGQLLDKILLAIDRDRSNTYITNIIPWRPPGNRAPTPMETEICRPFVERHIELIDPKLILLLGNSASKTMLNTKSGILSIRGRWHEVVIGEKTYRAMPSLHPAYLLRQPLHKRLAWRDFLAVCSALSDSD